MLMIGGEIVYLFLKKMVMWLLIEMKKKGGRGEVKI